MNACTVWPMASTAGWQVGWPSGRHFTEGMALTLSKQPLEGLPAYHLAITTLVDNRPARLSPGGRLTRTEDIPCAVVAMALSETSWISGNVIGVDGGENLTS